MSLLATIRESLASNESVYVSESQTYNYFPPSVKGYVEIRYIHVCPIDGLYDDCALQEFMDGLLTIKPSECRTFHRNNRDEMEFGALMFDEIVGLSHEQCWKTIDIVELDVGLPENFATEYYKVDTGVVSSELKRRINIFCYPDHGYMFDSEGRHTLSLKACCVQPPSTHLKLADIELAPAWMA